MRADDFKTMSDDELWSLYLVIGSELTKRITTRLAELEECFRKLQMNTLYRRAMRRSNAGEHQSAL